MATNIAGRNASVRNSFRVTYEDYVTVGTEEVATGEKDKTGKPIKEPREVKAWKTREIVGIFKPNEHFEFWVAHNLTRIAKIEEIPT